MAPKLRRRMIRMEDIATPQLLLDVLNPLYTATQAALDGGVTLDNIRHVWLDMLVTPPSPWTPLELQPGSTVFNGGSHEAPAVRWTPSGTQYRGILVRAASGVGGAPFARIPDSVSALRPSPTAAVVPVAASVSPGNVDVNPDGLLFLTTHPGFPANGFISLWGASHASTLVPPEWAVPQEADLNGPGGVDYGSPSFVFCMGATREDRKPTNPDFLPEWETPLVGIARKQKRIFRLKYLGGLDAGVEHRVQFLCLYL